MDVDQMLREIGAHQLHEWFAFSVLEGFGEARADLRNGILASVLANVHRDAKKKPSPFKPSDFIPRIKEDTVRKDEADLKAALSRMAKEPKAPKVT